MRIFKKRTLFIRHKLILTIYLILFPVLIITSGIIFYNNYSKTFNDAVRQYDSILHAIGSNIEAIEKDVTDIAVYFSVNSEIHTLLADPTASLAKDTLFWTKQAPMDIIKDIFAIKNHMRTMILYPENGLAPFRVSNDASVHDTDIEHIRALPVYELALLAKGDSICARVNAGEQGLFLNNHADKIIFCRELFDLSKKRKLGFLAITIDVSWYERICRTALLHDNETILILNPDGNEVARVGEIDDALLEYITSCAFISDTEHKMTRFDDMYIFSSTLGEMGKTVYYFSPVDNWSSWLKSGITLPLILALTLLVCMWPLSSIASRMISRPLDKLYRSMSAFKSGDFYQQVEVVGSDEIAELSTAFNQMVQDLSALINHNYVMALRERESELNALQAQINPHFLYNALDSLYWQAIECGQDNLAEDVLALSDLFRLLLSSGESEVPVEQELKLIFSYLRIQKMRFYKKFEYDIDVDERLFSKHIPKLILQPFVENAVLHGIEGKDNCGFVRVAGIFKDNYMVFTIEDNGVGMSQETLDEILSPEMEMRYARQRIGHYAIKNVRERMALRYGEDCKLEIKSTLGTGSVIQITLPIEVTQSLTANGGV